MSATKKNTQAKTQAETAKVPLCAMPDVPDRPFGARVSRHREALIRLLDKKWVNGTVLHYCFLDKPEAWRGGADQKKVVRESFQEWKELGLGLEFVEVDEPREAEIRIGFEQPAGSWSYVGRDNIDLATNPTHRTMNFGWDLTTDYGRDTALHEIGHAIGFSHEHQNPNAGIVWDRPAVFEYFSGPPNNWSEAQIRHNILRKLTVTDTGGSEWDKNSIMHYHFPAGVIRHPEEYQTEPLVPQAGLSRIDVTQVLEFFPELAPKLPGLLPYESQRINIEPGGQLNFEIKPDLSRDYTFQTFGAMDTVMVLFEEVDGEPRFYKADDDSGYDLNARFSVRLMRGRTYILRLRLYHAEQTGMGAVMMW